MKFEDSRNYRVSSERAKKTFDFNPIITVDEGIEELQRLIVEGRIKELGIKRHSNYLFLKESLEQEKTESWL